MSPVFNLSAYCANRLYPPGFKRSDETVTGNNPALISLGKLKASDLLENIIHSLHPTPAICGIPRSIATDFIIKKEDIPEIWKYFINNEDFKKTNVNSLVYTLL